MGYGRLMVGAAVFVLVISVFGTDAANAQFLGINDTAWARQYNGSGNGNDEAFAVEVDADGNVYVGGNSNGDTTGLDFTILKYDSTGVLLWERTYDGPGHTTDTATSFWLDGAANVYITGGSQGAGTGFDYATLKYDSDGTLLWERRFSASTLTDFATALALDPGGNVYVTGHSRGIGTGQDYLTLKYDPAGTLIWQERFNGFGIESDTAFAIAVDGSSYIYVTGTSKLAGVLGDIVTVAYDPAGTVVWTDRYDGTGMGYDRPYDLAVSTAGDIYVAGSTWGAGTRDDFVTLKYAGGGVGTRLWDVVYNGTGGWYDIARVVRVDAVGNAYVVGASDSPFPFIDDIVTIKYDPSGAVLWERRYASPISGDDAIPHDAELTPSGDIWIGGYSDSILVDFTALNYTAAGDLVQTRRFYVATYTEDFAYAIDLDGDGAIYLAGTTRPTGGRTNVSTIKLWPCACPFHVDYDEDGFLTAIDFNHLIDVAFFGQANLRDQGCPMSRLDFDCSGFVDAADVNAMIDYLFFNGTDPCVPCDL